MRNLASDNSFLNENSPIYLGLSSSNFWRKIPDSVTKKIDAFYRIRLTQVQLTFNKANEYSTYCINNFLRPNDLMYFNLTSTQLIARLRGIEEGYLSYVKLFMSSTQRLEFVLNQSEKKIEELVRDLKIYNESKRLE